MNKKIARPLQLVCLLGVAVSALVAYLYLIHFNTSDPTQPVPIPLETTNSPITNSVPTPQSTPPPFSGAENRSNSEIQNLAKKYGTTEEERKAYVAKIKEKQANRTAHDAAVADFRESLRGMRGSSDATSNEAALRLPW
jgi:hypothetical protein